MVDIKSLHKKLEERVKNLIIKPQKETATELVTILLDLTKEYGYYLSSIIHKDIQINEVE